MMFINKTHGPSALRGTYLFPYVIGTVYKERFWQPTSSAILSEDALPNQLFSTNHRLGFLGQVVKSQLSWIESIEIATEHNINMNVLLSDVGEVLFSTREAIRIRRWEEFESFISYSFGLEVK